MKGGGCRATGLVFNEGGALGSGDDAMGGDVICAGLLGGRNGEWVDCPAVLGGACGCKRGGGELETAGVGCFNGGGLGVAGFALFGRGLFDDVELRGCACSLLLAAAFARASASALEITPSASAHESTAHRAASSVYASWSCSRFVRRASSASRGSPFPELIKSRGTRSSSAPIRMLISRRYSPHKSRSKASQRFGFSHTANPYLAMMRINVSRGASLMLLITRILT